MSSDSDAEVRVSFREVKEESYRALRQAGYAWGVSQVAGRCAGVAQVLFGTGVDAVLHDASRWGAAKRAAYHSSKADHVVISSRGMSWATVGPIAVAAALAKNQPVIWVRGSRVGPELAAVIWDLKVSSSEPIVWGSKTAGGWDGFQLGENGDVFSSTVSPNRIGRVPLMASWFVCVGGGQPDAVFLTNQSKQDQVFAAHRQGVGMVPAEWNKLERLARKFLVPE